MQTKPANCFACGAELKTIDYTIWGAKIFRQETKSYVEDDSVGDMEFSCPNCSAKLNPDGLIF
jgi:hypothetical protein